jgi:signal peptidase I
MDNRKIAKDISLKLLSEGKTIRIKAHGYSMYPGIKPGSIILIEPVGKKGIPVPGEIIAVKRENGLVVHRLVRIVTKNGVTGFIARGDSNAYADNPVSYDMIAGRIVGAEITGENTVPADIKKNTRPQYFLNRLRVIRLILWKKLRLLAPWAPLPPKGG